MNLLNDRFLVMNHPLQTKKQKVPPKKFYRRTLSDAESDVSESEIFDVDEKGACMSVNVTNPSKSVLLAQLMSHQKDMMEKMMERMCAQIDKL